MPNSRALHGERPSLIHSLCAILPLIHGLCAFFRPLLTPEALPETLSRGYFCAYFKGYFWRSSKITSKNNNSGGKNSLKRFLGFFSFLSTMRRSLPISI